ncbi:hypothetical protein ABZ805_09980 [Saccharopolyspora sp. NPDC047091]|uniref:terpene synthase family protein n=1 Tax=Saccharopolyspora sp. NPDC047091 TaxID=3155924 RepID=UPI0033D7FDF9
MAHPPDATGSGVTAAAVRDQVLLAAWTHPDVPGAELALIACFEVWAAAVRGHVRRCSGAVAERYVAGLHEVVTGAAESRDAADPVGRALRDLRARVAPSWRRQVDAALIDLLRGQAAESAGTAVSRVPNPIDHLGAGRTSGPGPWAARLVAYGLRVRIPRQVAGSAEFRAVHDAFCDVVLLRTRRAGAPEEPRAELSDSVVVLQRHFGQSRARALAMLEDLLAWRAHRFEELTGSELPALLAECADGAERDAVLRYVQGLRDWSAGLLACRPDTVVPTAGPPRPASRRTSNQVRLPEFFMPFDTRRNPGLDAARRHTREWAREHGLLHGVKPWTAAAFDAADYALLAALTEPDAAADELDAAADWQVWSWYADDHLLARTTGFRDRLAELLRRAPEPREPWERALLDLWRRTTGGLEPRRRREFAVRLAERFDHRLAEVHGPETPDPLVLLASRRRSCGAEFTAALLRHRHAEDLPAELFTATPMRVLVETFAEVSALRHDLFRYRAAPGTTRAPNVVAAVAAFLGCRPQQAVSLTDDLCTARLRRFESVAHWELPALSGEFDLDAACCARLERYVRGMQQWMAGELRWVSVTGRYAGTGDRPRRVRRALGRPGRPDERFLRRAPG